MHLCSRQVTTRPHDCHCQGPRFRSGHQKHVCTKCFAACDDSGRCVTAAGKRWRAASKTVTSIFFITMAQCVASVQSQCAKHSFSTCVGDAHASADICAHALLSCRYTGCSVLQENQLGALLASATSSHVLVTAVVNTQRTRPSKSHTSSMCTGAHLRLS